jgi:hypothetical protein
MTYSSQKFLIKYLNALIYNALDSNITDSPLQAWTDNLSSSSASSSNSQELILPDTARIQNITHLTALSGSFDELHAKIWAQVCLAKSAMNSAWSPNINLDNGLHLSLSIHMSPAMLYEMAGEFLSLEAGRQAPKEITMGSAMEISEINSSVITESSDIIEIHNSAAQGKGKEIAFEVPECTSQVRRSTRSNKYDGFNHKNLSEARAIKSKVKPRKIPCAKPHISKNKKMVNSAALHLASDALKETPVPVMQSIAINLCGVPPDEISEEKLLGLPLEKDKAEEASDFQPDGTA